MNMGKFSYVQNILTCVVGDNFDHDKPNNYNQFPNRN